MSIRLGLLLRISCEGQTGMRLEAVSVYLGRQPLCNRFFLWSKWPRNGTFNPCVVLSSFRGRFLFHDAEETSVDLFCWFRLCHFLKLRLRLMSRNLLLSSFFSFKNGFLKTNPDQYGMILHITITRPGKHTKSYWKCWFIVDFPIKNGDFP